VIHISALGSFRVVQIVQYVYSLAFSSFCFCSGGITFPCCLQYGWVGKEKSWERNTVWFVKQVPTPLKFLRNDTHNPFILSNVYFLGRKVRAHAIVTLHSKFHVTRMGKSECVHWKDLKTCWINDMTNILRAFICKLCTTTHIWKRTLFVSTKSRSCVLEI